MTNTQIDISVVIAAYTEERWDTLVAAVQSLRLQIVPPLETIVVIDNNPTLLTRARDYMPDVVVVENGEARGAAGARNSGVSIARGSVVAFLDDDAEAEPDWLEQLGGWYKDPRVIGVGGRLDPIWSSGKPSWFPEEFNWVVGCSYRGLPTTASAVRNLIAANMSVRRDAYIELGGFRSGFGNVKSEGGVRASLVKPCAGDEETEFCIRALEQRPRDVWQYDPQAVVHHRVPASRGRWGYFAFRCYDEGLGKSRLVRLTGSRSGLSSERGYTLRTLPTGVLLGVARAVTGLTVAPLLQSAAIIAGLVTTVAGYLVGIVASLGTQATAVQPNANQ